MLRRHTVEPPISDPKMPRLSGHLWEVVAYENRTTGGFFREEVWTHLSQGREFIAYNFQATIYAVPCCYQSS